jgi:hypothetical protein
MHQTSGHCPIQHHWLVVYAMHCFYAKPQSLYYDVLCRIETVWSYGVEDVDY